MPVPRARRTVSKTAKSQREQGFDSHEATTRQSSATENAPARVGRPRGRPAAVHKVTKPAQRAKRQGEQATEALLRRGPLSRREANAQEVDKRRGNTLDEIENSAAAKEQQQRGPQRSRSASSDDEDDILKGPEEVMEENSEAQKIDPLMMKGVNGASGKPSAPWINSQSDRRVDEAVADESDTVLLRRRFSELSKQHEGLQARHRELQEVGIRAAEVNFQRLKQQTDENTKASEDLIAQLREDLARRSRALEQTELLRRQLELSQAEVKDLRENLETANDALSKSRSEIKAMSVKLTASRTNEIINAKASNASSKAAGPAANRAFQETIQLSQAKEDLYGDLTGLIVRDLKRGQKEDVFDCIQTGRNGSIHFKLGVEKSDGADYEGVQFTYRPQLDANRDSEVIEMLPDYLTEEITFPRGHASKFYTRLTKALTERLD